jgi:hypothetical protein
MSWVEELKPDDEVKVEILYPTEYVDKCTKTMRQYASGISHLCKGAMLLGEEETEFLVFGMTVMQVISIEEIMRQFGVDMTHDMGKLENGTSWTYFYCDLHGLKEMFEEGENTDGYI